MIDASSLQDCARRLRQLGVARLDIGASECLVHLRLPLDAASDAPSSTAGNPAPALPPGLAATLVRSEGLGLLRLSHPEQLPQAIQAGDTVEQGQVLALLQLDDLITAVRAPQAGTIEAVLGHEGAVADYGMALFRYMPPAATALAPPATATVTPPTDAAPATPSSAGTHTILAPMSGTFYRAARPGAAPLVEVGTRVDIGTPLCVLEAMKMLNELPTEHAGTLARILCEDGQMIEAGQPLFILNTEETRGVS